MVDVPSLWNNEAEMAVLGSIFIDPPALHEIADRLRPEHFHGAANRAVYRAMLALERGDVLITAVTLAEALERGKTPAPMHGWDDYLLSLLNTVATSFQIGSHARIIMDYARRRSLLSAAERLGKLAYDLEQTAEQALGQGVDTVLSLQDTHDDGRVIAPRDYVRRFLDYLENGDEHDTIATPLTGWNQMLLGGLARPFTHLLAARPKMGKSALALQVAGYAALKLDKRVYLATTEMSDRQFTRRIVSQQTGIPAADLATRNLSPGDMAKAMEAAGRLSESELHLDTSAGLTPTQVRARAMRLAARGGLDLMIVDHLHEMTADNPRPQRHLELGDMTRSLRDTAKEIGVPLLLVAQLSRQSEHRAEKRPQLADLREAGAIEEVAYSVTFVFREHYYNETKPERDAELIVAAHRDGPTGTVYVDWKPALMRFENRTVMASSNGQMREPAPLAL